MRAGKTEREIADTACGYDGVLCFAGIDWWYHNRAHSEVQIMRELSKHTSVVFVNSLGMRMPNVRTSTQPMQRILRKLGSMSKGLRKVAERMWVFTPIMLPPGSKPIIRKINAHLIAIQVRWVLKKIGINRWFTWVTVPTALDVVKALPESLTIFNRSDAFSKFPEVREEFIKSCEEELLRKSDLVLYVNRKLMAEDIGPANRKHYLGHGVDFKRFAGVNGEKKKVHPALANLKRPIVGFFGAIDDYTVDLKLLKFAAQSLPQMSFVLIGLSTVDISDITSLPNVHYFGFRPYSQIPEFGAGFDVAIMPWLQNEWIQYCNPIKLKEYLAIGQPIVTTPIPQAEDYPGLLAVARTPDEFVDAIRNSLTENNGKLKHARQQAVRAQAWDSKADKVLELVEKISPRPIISG